MRIEPPVSDPSAAQTAAVATDTAPPEVEPPGMRGNGSSSAVAGFAGVPWCGLMPTPEKANSLMLVRPSRAAPACLRRATARQSRTAAGCAANTVDPAAVTSPCTSNRSLTLTARPASAGSGAALAPRRSTASAATAAAVKRVLIKACRQAGASAAVTDACSNSLAERRPLAMSARAAIRSGVMG